MQTTSLEEYANVTSDAKYITPKSLILTNISEVTILFGIR